MNDLKDTQNPPLRIGLFGGTFNPIHRGHLQVANDVQGQFSLDRICFIPCGLPPHKTHGILAPGRDRFEMVRLALGGHQAVTLSSIEINRAGPSYTIDTLRELKDGHATNTTFFFLVGIDAFLEIHTWKSYQDLFDLTAFIVMTRPTSGSPVQPLPPRALEYTHRHISQRYALDQNGRTLAHPAKKPIYLAKVTPVPIASSQIRDMIRRVQPIHEWVHEGVSDYIDQKGLYR